MRIVKVQKLWLSLGKGLLSHRYSAPLRRTSWVVGKVNVSLKFRNMDIAQILEEMR